MIRDLMLLPGVPRRMLDDIGEMKELVRELLETEHDLTRTSKEMGSQVPELGKGPLEKAKDALTGGE